MTLAQSELEHSRNFPNEAKIIERLSSVFNIKEVQRRKRYDTELSLYFAKPAKTMTESFGFEQEIAIFLTGSAKMEPRVMQAIHQVMSEGGAVGRVDPNVYFLVSEEQNALESVENYVYQNPQLSFPVVLTTSALDRLLLTNLWALRNLIGEQLYFRDLFDYQLPIHNDLEFFGRRALIAGIVDSVRKGRNTGLFGLRKTGKSSVLEKVRRTLNTTKLAHVLFYDCKLPSVRELKANRFLQRILTDLYQSAGRTLDKAFIQRHPSDAFVQGCAQISKKQPVCIMFDEVEYISPLTRLNTHWQTDFIPFWQTLWAAQSQPSSRLSLVIAGVNPTVAEVDSFNGVQNPMFGILRPTYIKGLEDEAMGNMIQFFGTGMGLHFTQNAINYLINRYGGHPSLTRRACSYVHSSVATRQLERPTPITEEMIRRDEELRDAELTFYCRHIVSELNDFYPAEYEMLEMLSAANTVEFMELQRDPELVRHITEYGLVRLAEGVRPKFEIPVVGRYIASERARRYGVRVRREIIRSEKRREWLDRRKGSILREARSLQTLLQRGGAPEIFSGESPRLKNCGKYKSSQQKQSSVRSST